MRKLLWVGDAVHSSGFAKATHYTLDVLRQTWDVAVLGLNSFGEPHEYPYPIWPCMAGGTPEFKVGGDAFGLNRMSELITRLKPDLVVVQNDPWNVPQYVKRCGDVPVVATVAVDGKNCRGQGLNGCKGVIFWTDFAEREARAGGYTGPSAVIPLGVDLTKYHPRDHYEARKAVGLPPKIRDKFIVGNINRNQPRKRMDLTISFFAQWVREYKIDDAYLFLHVAPTGDMGYDVSQLMSYYGLSSRLIVSEPPTGFGIDESKLAEVYSCFDTMITTTQGEGWGLTTMEGMACGIPQIVPEWSALAEWATAAIRVPCSEIATTFNRINCIGGIADRGRMIDALQRVYSDVPLRQQMAADGLALVNRPEYRWTDIGQKFAEALEMALAPMHLSKPLTEVLV